MSAASGIGVLNTAAVLGGAWLAISIPFGAIIGKLIKGRDR